MVYLFLANGFEEIEALLPLDLLRRGGVDVTTVAVGGADGVIGAHGIRVEADIPDTLFRDSRPEAVILPGGMPGAENLAKSRTVESALRVTHTTGGLLPRVREGTDGRGDQPEPRCEGRKGHHGGGNGRCDGVRT